MEERHVSRNDVVLLWKSAAQLAACKSLKRALVLLWPFNWASQNHLEVIPLQSLLIILRLLDRNDSLG